MSALNQVGWPLGLLGRTPLLFRRMEKRSAFRHRASNHFQVIMYDHFGQRRD